MKKSILTLLLYVPFVVFGQCHSWDGKSIKPNEKLHYLNIFVNIIYDVHPNANNTFNNHNYWPTITDPSLEGINTAAIPSYLLDWMDTVYVPGQLHGTCTRLYGESSFDSLQITGDFVVVNLRESTVLNYGAFDRYNIQNVATSLLGQYNAFTLFGHHNLTDFNAQNVLIRNITKNYGGLNPGSGYGGRNTLQCVGDGDLSTNPTCIVTHEISHGLFGTNAFHTSGGNHRYPDNTVMSFLNVQGGYGLMGAAHSGLVCCNGYERWRMHWKHPQSVDYISARDAANTQSVASDVTREDGNQTFLLRDFVTYGDVVRIKLPYKDSVTSSNQYIWLENHQVGSNGKLDFLQYSNIDHHAHCRPPGAAGIYAYYQVGRDILEGTISEVWDSYNRDNLRIIPAEGYYDFELVADTYNANCVSNEPVTYAYRRGVPNPLCGGQDQEFQLFPLETDNVLYLSRELEPWRKVIDNQNYDCLPFLGDTMDAFRTHTKINMGTNPSTNNVKTYHSNNHAPSNIISAKNPEKNVQTTYLTGLSVEMTPIQGTGNFLVNIRWDDYNITNDTRWTGKIALKDTAILTMGNTITLAQNRTVAQPTRNPETGLFAGKTRWTCENGSYFRQDSASALILTENSNVIFENGSRYDLSKGARVEIQAGCSLTVRQGAMMQLKGTVEVDSGGVLTLYDTAKLGSSTRLIVRPGGKLVVDRVTCHTPTAQPIGDPYSLTETRFMEGYAEMFAENAETDADNVVAVGANDDSPLHCWYASTFFYVIFKIFKQWTVSEKIYFCAAILMIIHQIKTKKMKKLFILMAAACCLTFTACNNNKPAEQPAENTEMQAEDHPCCKEMTEEQKAEMEACKKAGEDWQNWENLTDERKAELLDMRKAKYDEMQAMKKAQEEKKAKFEAAMLNWDKLSLEDRKAAFDEMGCCGGCKGGDKPGCHKEGGCHKDQGCHKEDGCHKEGGKCPKGN